MGIEDMLSPELNVYSEANRVLAPEDDICTIGSGGFNETACLDTISVTVDKFIALNTTGVITRASSNSIWLVITGALVFFMHAGFTMLEAGSVRKLNVVNIMFKNVGTVTIGAVIYWLVGFGFAYGVRENTGNKFIGNSYFAYDFDDEDPAFFFFQFTFAATGATIVSGAVAERITLEAYFVIATMMTGMIFPVVSHWVWSSEGFMSAFANGGDLVSGSIGLIDYAGSGVVHATGGMVALAGAYIIGPRQGRFVDGESISFKPASHTLQTLGTFILWFGWFGFNPGSTLTFDGTNSAKAAVTTTLAPAAAGVVATIYSRSVRGYYDLSLMLNCILAGLVSITSGCTSVADFSALFIGGIGALVYIGSANLLDKLRIDDPIGAAPVHGFCGVWGVLATGIFLNGKAVKDAYGIVPDGGSQFAMQLVGAILISVWSLIWGAFMFSGLKLANILRVDTVVETAGLDVSEHGGQQVIHF